jgi:hypothetical protein
MMDWGYSSPFCVLWGAVDYDGRIWIYREMYDKQMTASQVAEWILSIEEQTKEVVAYSVGDHIWDKRGSSAPTHWGGVQQIRDYLGQGRREPCPRLESDSFAT